VLRENRVQTPARAERLRAGDAVYIIASAADTDLLNRLFIAPHHPDRLEEHQFFGDLVLDADANLSDIAQFYGVEMPPGSEGQTLGAYLARVFRKRPAVGDRIRAGRVDSWCAKSRTARRARGTQIQVTHADFVAAYRSGAIHVESTGMPQAVS
jgi:cell volume regulation protein A